MKRIVRGKLQPDAASASSLMRTLIACNEAANFAARVYRERNITNHRTFQPMVYADLKARGLSAQPSLLAISKGKGAYATLGANLTAVIKGLGGCGSEAALFSVQILVISVVHRLLESANSMVLRGRQSRPRCRWRKRSAKRSSLSATRRARPRRRIG